MSRFLLRISVLVCLLTVAVTGCGEPTAPEQQPRLLLGLGHVETSIYTMSLDEPGIGCDASIRSFAVGALRWKGATVSYFQGRDRTVPVEQVEVPETQVQEWWGGPDVRAQDTLALRFDAGAPFGVKLDFRYTVPGAEQQQTASVRFDCGSTLSPGTPTPTLTQLTVTPATGEVQAGDVVRVSYRMEGAAPLWLTTVQLLGACDERRNFPERGERAVAERTVDIAVPVACAGAESLSVRVLGWDVGLGEVSRVGATLTMVDHTPPVVTGMGFRPITGASTTGGDFFAGDSLRVQVSARDNQGIATLGWEVLPHGHRDSLRIDSYTVNQRQIAIPVPAEWVGTVQLRLFVRDAAGLTSEAVTSAPDSIRIHPTVARQTTSWQSNAWINEAIWDEAHERIYALQAGPNQIAVLSASSFEVQQTIPLPDLVGDLDVTPNGDTLLVLVANRQSVGVVDLTGSIPSIEWHPVLGAHALMKVQALGGGRAFVQANFQEAPSWRLLEMDLATGAIRMRSDVDESVLGALQFGRSSDYGVHVLNGYRMQRYDAVRDEFSPAITGGLLNAVPSVDTAGKRIAMGMALYDGVLHPLRPSPMLSGQDPLTMISPDGTALFHIMNDPYGLVQTRALDGAFVDRTPLTGGARSIQISRDGSTLFVAQITGLKFVRLR